MFLRKFNWIILLVLGLAAFGFVMTLINDPMYLVKMALIFVAVGGLFYFLYKRFIAGRMGGQVSGQYKQAARYSAKKYQSNNTGPFKSKPVKPSPKPKANASFSKATKKRKNNHNLKVIEGKKGKKKNRAL